MSAHRPPSPSPFKPVPESPRLDAAFRGIVLAAPARTPDPAGTLVHGALQVPEKDFVPGAGVLDAVALVLNAPPPNGPYQGSGMAYRAWMPFRDRVILADDVQRTGGLVRGYFNLALPDDVPKFAFGKFFLLASVGPHVSDVLTIQIG
jgi:hypothetical protein